jgi:hypothetical protein
VRQSVRKSPALSRTALYSGKYRPACRINHTGGGLRSLRLSTSRTGLLTLSYPVVVLPNLIIKDSCYVF